METNEHGAIQSREKVLPYNQCTSRANDITHPVLCGQSCGQTIGKGNPDRCPDPTMCCCAGRGQQLGSQLSDRPCHTPLCQNSCSQLHPQPRVLIQGDQYSHAHTQQAGMQKINATCLRPRLILLLLLPSLECVCMFSCVRACVCFTFFVCSCV